MKDWEIEALWAQLQVLDEATPPGAVLHLAPIVRSVLERAAPTVGVTSAEVRSAIGNQKRATALAREMYRRVREGSERIGDALDKMYDHQEAGDIGAAREEMEAVLAVEVVPLYREIAEGEIAKMDAGQLDLPGGMAKRKKAGPSRGAGTKRGKSGRAKLENLDRASKPGSSKSNPASPRRSNNRVGTKRRNS